MEFTSTGTEYVDEFFAHHGIKGQKWGIRRFQNEDGTLTEAGKKRYNKIVERYKNDKGEFSTRKSTKASIATALSGGATGLGLTLAGLPMVGVPIVAASGAAATIGAIKRERARRFLENTGTGDIKDISLDRRYATNFDILGLGALINTAYGTHREKVAEQIKNELANTKMSDIKKDTAETKDKANVTDSKETGKEKTEKKESDRKKQLSHSDFPGVTFNDALSAGETIEHSGIKGQKWGLRRFQYNDGSLTPEGRKRYLKGGDKAVRKAEKQRAKREAILSDRKKLYKHRNEFTKEEIDKAMARFASQDALRMQMNAEKEAKRHDRAELKRSKIEYKKLKLQQKQMAEQEKQAKLSTEQKKLETEQKKESADIQAASIRWRERVNKAKTIVEFAKVGKDILDDMGITSKEEGESLLGSFATAIGIKDVSAKKAAAELKKKREKAQADWDFETKKMAYEKAKEEFDDRAAKKQRQEAMDELKRRQEEAKTKTAEYNANNPGKGGKGGGLTADDIEDILKKYGVI